MEMIDSLRFVIDTLPKIEVMMKMLKDVTHELYRNQLIARHSDDAMRRQLYNKEKNNGDELWKRLSNTNIFSNDMPLENISTLLNLYLNDTIVAKDSIMTTGTKRYTTFKQNISDGSHNKAYISTFSAMAAQNITQPRFSSLSENFRISETINTAIIADASIVADCTNNFMEKITQNEVQTNIKPDTSANVNISTIKVQEPEIKQKDVKKSRKSIGKITRRRRGIKKEESKVNIVEDPIIEPTKIEDMVELDSKSILKNAIDVKDIKQDVEQNINPETNDSKPDMKTASAREDRVVRRGRRKIRFSVNNRNSRRSTIVVRKSIVIDPKPYKCPECSYAGTKKGYLMRHMKKHAKEALFACELCAKRFLEKNSLAEHMYTHNKNTTKEK